MLVVVTYDENGGPWDHMPPPTGNGWGDRWDPRRAFPRSSSRRSPNAASSIGLPTTRRRSWLITRRFDLEALPGVREKMGDLTGASIFRDQPTSIDIDVKKVLRLVKKNDEPSWLGWGGNVRGANETIDTRAGGCSWHSCFGGTRIGAGSCERLLLGTSRVVHAGRQRIPEDDWRQSFDEPERLGRNHRPTQGRGAKSQGRRVVRRYRRPTLRPPKKT
jgi:hypothetical protein